MLIKKETKAEFIKKIDEFSKNNPFPHGCIFNKKISNYDAAKSVTEFIEKEKGGIVCKQIRIPLSQVIPSTDDVKIFETMPIYQSDVEGKEIFDVRREANLIFYTKAKEYRVEVIEYFCLEQFQKDRNKTVVCPPYKRVLSFRNCTLCGKEIKDGLFV